MAAYRVLVIVLGLCVLCSFQMARASENATVDRVIRAAREGNVKAQNSLGLRYLQGRGVTQDSVQAAEWFRKAAEQGLDKAQYNLGLLYDRGQGVAPNAARAARWYRRAAEQGFVKAQYNLGGLYERGGGTLDKDLEQAAEWYHKAADQGLSKAQHNLGGLYARGQGVAQDRVKAYALFSLAAAQGYARAQENMEVLERRMDENELKKAERMAGEMRQQ